MMLRELRKENRKTLAYVANVLGVSVSAVSNYEQGTRRISLENVLELAKLYGEDAETIIKAQLSSLNDR